MSNKYYVAGQIVIPIYYPVNNKDNNTLEAIRSKFNMKSISFIEGDIHAKDGIYPLQADRCRVTWSEIVGKDELI